jgi:hypothetical protein
MTKEEEKIINDYLIKCIKNNRHCAHCYLNHNGVCFFAAACFEDDQKYYKEDDDDELE